MPLRRPALLVAALLLATGLSGCFSSPPQIIALQPSRGSIGVPADAPIVVQFDRTIDTQSVVGRFQVSPPIAGCDLTAAFNAGPGSRCRIVWNAGDSGFTLLHPRAVMASNKLYTFTLLGGFRDLGGIANTVDHHWQLTTELPPEVRTVVPADGATSVAADAPLVVTFSTIMDPLTTAAAITLSPSIAGTRVEPNRRDLSRFVVLPGAPLVPGDVYHLEVAASATDEHGEALKAPVNTTFTAGAMTPGDHATLLLGARGQPASQVAVALLANPTAGDPVAAETVLTAPRCARRQGCGAVAQGGLLYTFTAATLAPDARWLAVVEQDLTLPGTPTSIAVVNAADGALRTVIAGGSLPSWSRDSQSLAFAISGSAAVQRIDTATASLLPAGDPLVAPAAWGPRDELLVLTTSAGAGSHVELADADILLRYPVPGLSGAASQAELSPDGSTLAVVRDDPSAGGTWLVSLSTGPNAPRRLDAKLTPYGWLDTGTLLGTLPAGGGRYQAVAVSVSTGEESPLPLDLGGASLPSLCVAPSGRLLAYLAPAAGGGVTATAENSDGSEVLPLLLPAGTTLQPAAVTLS